MESADRWNGEQFKIISSFLPFGIDWMLEETENTWGRVIWGQGFIFRYFKFKRSMEYAGVKEVVGFWTNEI